MEPLFSRPKNPGSRPVQDILRDGRRHTVFLQKKPSLGNRFKKQIVRRHGLITSILVVMLLFLGTRYFFQSRASVAEFYPASCLGGWENPAYAAGKPEADMDAPDSFTGGNSAVLRGGSASQIFCGGFSGDIPDGTRPTRLTVRLGWTFKEPETVPVAGTATDTIPTVTATDGASVVAPDPGTTEVPPAPTSTDTGTSTEPEPPAGTSSEPVPEDNPGASTNPFLPDTQTVPEQTVPPPATPAPDPAPAPAPEPSPAPAAWLISRVYAAEENAASTATGTAASTTEAAPVPEDFAVEVLYTRDGENWESLGRVARDNWQSFAPEIPVDEETDWTALQKLQISIRAISTTGDAPTVYLDSVTLAAEYAALNAETPAAATSTDAVTASTTTSTASSTVVSTSTASSTLENETDLSQIRFAHTLRIEKPKIEVSTSLSGQKGVLITAQAIENVPPDKIQSGWVSWSFIPASINPYDTLAIRKYAFIHGFGFNNDPKNILIDDGRSVPNEAVRIAIFGWECVTAECDSIEDMPLITFLSKETTNYHIVQLGEKFPLTPIE